MNQIPKIIFRPKSANQKNDCANEKCNQTSTLEAHCPGTDWSVRCCGEEFCMAMAKDLLVGGVPLLEFGLSLSKQKSQTTNPNQHHV